MAFQMRVEPGCDRAVKTDKISSWQSFLRSLECCYGDHPWKQAQCVFCRAFKFYHWKEKWSLNFVLLPDLLLYILFLPQQGNNLLSVLVQLIILLMIQLIQFNTGSVDVTSLNNYLCILDLYHNPSWDVLIYFSPGVYKVWHPASN